MSSNSLDESSSPETASLPGHKVDALPILAFVIALLSLLGAWNRIKHTTGRDFYQFWLVGREMKNPEAIAIYGDEFRHHVGELYFQKAQATRSTEFIIATSFHRTLETFSTPWLYSVFHLIGADDFSRSLLIYKCILFASGIGSILILGRILGYSNSATLLIMSAVLGFGQAFADEADCLNVGQVQVLGVAILVWIQLAKESRVRDIFAGAWLASLVMFKPNLLMIPMLLGISWFMDGQRRRMIWQAIAFAMTAIVILVATSVQFHSARIWIDWIGAMRELDRLFSAAGAGSSSLWALMTTTHGAAMGWLVAIAVPLVAILGTLASAYGIGRRSSSRDEQKTRTSYLISLGCVVPLLAGRLAWMHYFALCTPLLLIVFRPRESAERRDWFIARCILGSTAILLLSQAELISQGIWLGDPVASAERLNGATILLFVLGLVELQRIGKRRDPGLRSFAFNHSGESDHATSNIR